MNCAYCGGELVPVGRKDEPVHAEPCDPQQPAVCWGGVEGVSPLYAQPENPNYWPAYVAAYFEPE